MKRSGHRRATHFDADLAVRRDLRRLPRRERPGLLSLFRRAKVRRPHRTFWELDPATGTWRML